MNRDAAGRFGPGKRLGRHVPKAASGNPAWLPAGVREARELVGDPRLGRMESLLAHANGTKLTPEDGYRRLRSGNTCERSASRCARRRQAGKVP